MMLLICTKFSIANFIKPIELASNYWVISFFMVLLNDVGHVFIDCKNGLIATNVISGRA
jgi:hypothetical protein